MATQLEAPLQRKGQLEVCPWCGQELLDHEAVHHVEESEREYQHALETAAKAKAEQLAAELTRKKDAEVGQLRQRMAAQQEKLAQERARHAEALREQKAKLRDDAEREATKKVRADLLKKERLITGLKEQIDEQSRRIEHLTADERGEMNEELLLAQLQAAFPDDHIQRVGRGRMGGDILHEVRVSSGDGPVAAGLVVYECKDTQRWSNGFLEQARKEGRTHGTPYLVIVTGAFPRGEKMLCVKDGVVVVHPLRAHRPRPSHAPHGRGGPPRCAYREGRTQKAPSCASTSSSVDFRQTFDTLAHSSDKLAGLLGKERTWHERDWARRQTIYEDVAERPLPSTPGSERSSRRRRRAAPRVGEKHGTSRAAVPQ